MLEKVQELTVQTWHTILKMSRKETEQQALNTEVDFTTRKERRLAATTTGETTDDHGNAGYGIIKRPGGNEYYMVDSLGVKPEELQRFVVCFKARALWKQ